MAARYTKLVAVLTVWIISAGIFLYVGSIYNQTGTLSGEEASVSFRDPYFLSERLQHNFFATNLGAHIFFRMAQEVSPDIDLFYGRSAKGIFVATGPALITYILILYYGLSAVSAAALGLLFALSPGVFCFSALATEYGLEIPTLALTVLCAMSPSITAKVIAGFAAGISAISYGPGLTAVGILIVQLLLLPISGSNKIKKLSALMLPLLACAAVLIFPKVFWRNDPSLFIGGGNLSTAAEFYSAGEKLIAEILVKADSYYFFSELKLFFHPLLPVLAIVSLFAFARKRRELIVVAGVLGSLALYLISGKLPGARRAEPIVFFLILALGIGVRGIIVNKPSLEKFVNLALGLILVLSLQGLFVQRESFQNKRIYIPNDFLFPVIPNLTMVDLLQKVDAGEELSLEQAEPDRTLTILGTIVPERYPRELILAEIQQDRLERGLEKFPFFDSREHDHHQSK